MLPSLLISILDGIIDLSWGHPSPRLHPVAALRKAAQYALTDGDANRALLDRRVVCDMLGFDDAVYEGVRMLAAKWCAEPSVHGGKRRPAGARLVV